MKAGEIARVETPPTVKTNNPNTITLNMAFSSEVCCSALFALHVIDQ
jgi:hypothetical protein